MPANTRQWAKRKFDQTHDNLDWSIYHLDEVSEKYRELHPEVSEPIDLVLKAIMQIQEALKHLKDSF